MDMQLLQEVTRSITTTTGSAVTFLAQMDNDTIKEVVRWLTKIAGAGIAILPLFLVIGLVKTVGQVDNLIGKFTGAASKGAGNFGEDLGKRIKGRRQIKAYQGKGFWGSKVMRGSARRSARRRAMTANIGAEAKREESQYIANLAQDNAKFANQLAGGMNAFGKVIQSASPEAMQRALAGAKFTIEKAELDEVKAAHVNIDSKDEKGLNSVLEDKNSSKYEKAAALERLVKVSSTKNLVEQINKHASGGQGDIITKSLANALAHDGLEGLKGSDIDNIARGQIGHMTDKDGNATPSQVEDLLLNNMEKGVYSEKKITQATGDELSYVSELAESRGATAALESLKSNARALVDNPTLKGDVKHNRSVVEGLAGKKINPDSTPPGSDSAYL